MLKAVRCSEAMKLGGIPATYRSSGHSMVGTCPTSCPFLPVGLRQEGSKEIDLKYAKVEAEATPRKGAAWSYSHFDYSVLEQFKDAPTRMNFSADDIQSALAAVRAGVPTTYAAPYDETEWPRKIEGVTFLRCPAETSYVTCASCGGGTPLCSRTRAYVIVFVSHGIRAKHTRTDIGGCYALNFPCSRHWKNTMDGTGRLTWDENEAPGRLTTWVKSLPPGTLLRHRIAGDLG